jgi:hypothetical protein
LNRYDKEYIRLESQRDKTIINEIALIFDKIRMQAQIIASDVAGKVEDNPVYLSQYGRNEKLAEEVNKTVRPDYLLKDKLSKSFYEQEYITAYMQSLYVIENTGIKDGYLVKLPKPQKKQMKDALNYPLSKLMSKRKMKTGRSLDIEQLYTTIVSGVEQGLSLPNINKNIDIALGYRDSAGKWIGKLEDRKGQTYRTMRILRTEVGRMRSSAETDQWINQQAMVESDLVWIATLDDRTRSQSANMDGQRANAKGEFRYPGNTGWHKQRQSGVAKYDINDRCTTINRDPEYPPESRIVRDPKTGKNTVEPYQDFKQYADKKGLKVNRYGETLFK